LSRFWVIARTPYGELGVEGSSADELRDALKSIGVSMDRVERILGEATLQLEGQKRSLGEGETLSTRVPPELVSKLSTMSGKDVVLAILFYERGKATKKELISRSNELGKPITDEWMNKHFAEKLKGLVTSTTENGEWKYGLSEQGRLVAKSRMEELLQSN
jgi:hypothetical protein